MNLYNSLSQLNFLLFNMMKSVFLNQKDLLTAKKSKSNLIIDCP